MMWLIVQLFISTILASRQISFNTPQSTKHVTVFIYTPGAALRASQSAGIFDSISEKRPNFYWGFPSLIFNIPLTVGQIKSAIEKSLDEILNKIRTKENCGINEIDTIESGVYCKVNLWLGGHSKGGIMVQDYVQSIFSKNQTVGNLYPTGIILFASTFQRKYREESWAKNFNLPVLTLGGDLDGLFRVSRMAEQYFHDVYKVARPNDAMHFDAPNVGIITDESRAIFQRPVMIIRGASHMSFSSSPIPYFVKLNDLTPTISEKDAHELIAQIMTDFINFHNKDVDPSQAAESENRLTSQILQSSRYFAPLVEAMLLEASPHILPACSDLPDSVEKKIFVNCFKSGPWVERLQKIAPSFHSVINGTIDVNSTLILSRTLPPVHINYTSACDSGKCSVAIGLTAQVCTSILDSFDVGYASNAAFEIKLKMSSAQHILQGLGYSNPSYEDLDKNDLRYCANLNEYTYNWAIERAKAYKEEFNNTSFNTNAITDRFERFGTKMIFGNDSVAGGGPGWLWGFLKYEQKKVNGSEVTVVSSNMYSSPTVYWVPSIAGLHYCKVLSPFRALEYIYVDSIKSSFKLK